MKKLILIPILLIFGLTFSQDIKETFNYSLHGEYNHPTNDYRTNLEIDTAANVTIYMDSMGTKLTVTMDNDTIFRHMVLSMEIDNTDGMITYHTTNLFYEAVLMVGNSGVTMLYLWVDDPMHFKYKYFWGYYENR
jgi:hypothetical protein